MLGKTVAVFFASLLFSLSSSMAQIDSIPSINSNDARTSSVAEGWSRQFARYPELVTSANTTLNSAELAALAHLLTLAPHVMHVMPDQRNLTLQSFRDLSFIQQKNWIPDTIGHLAQYSPIQIGDKIKTGKLDQSWLNAHIQFLDHLLLVAPHLSPETDLKGVQQAKAVLSEILRRTMSDQEQKLKRPNFDGSKIHPTAVQASIPAPTEVETSREVLPHSALLHSPGAPKPAEASTLETDSMGIAAQSFRGPKPLAESVEVQSQLATASLALEHRMTHSYPGHIGTDYTQYLIQEIEDFIKNTESIPNSQKHVVIFTFDVGDPRLKPIIQKLSQLKIRTTFAIDINQHMKGNFSNGKKENWDLENGTYNNAQTGQFVKFLRDDLKFGFRLEDGLFTVLSGVPYFDPEDHREKPLMHIKGLFLSVNGKAYGRALVATANLNAVEFQSGGPLPAFGGRLNRIWTVKDPVATQALWDHITELMDAFNKRLGTRGIKNHAPVRVNYPDGTYIEIAFTDGIQNPNDRKTNRARRAADPKNKMSLKEKIDSQFAKTFVPELEAERALMGVQEGFAYEGFYDQQTIWLDQYGISGALANFLVQKLMGRSVFPFRTEYEKRMKLWGYQRLLEKADKIDLQGAPSLMHLNHDKTAVTITEEVVSDPRSGAEETKSFGYIDSASLNDSGHYQSHEVQIEIKLNGEDPLLKEVVDGTRQVIASEPKWAIPLNLAIVRDWLAGFTQITPYDIDIKQYVETVIEALGKQDSSKVHSILSEVASLSTKSSHARQLETIKARIERFVGFLDWYAKQARDNSQFNPMTYKKAVNIGVGLIHPNHPWGLRTALDLLYWRPNQSETERIKLLKKAWQEGLEMDIPFPDDVKTNGLDDDPATQSHNAVEPNTEPALN